MARWIVITINNSNLTFCSNCGCLQLGQKQCPICKLNIAIKPIKPNEINKLIWGKFDD